MSRTLNPYRFASTGPAGSIVFKSTSTSAAWSPALVQNLGGGPIIWEVTGGVTIGPEEIDDPTFNFSSNSGTADIWVDGADNITYLRMLSLNVTEMIVGEMPLSTQFWINNNQLTELDFTDNGTVVIAARLQDNNLTTLDLLSNTNLATLFLQNNSSLGAALDITGITGLVTLNCSNCGLSSLDVSNNTVMNSFTIDTNASLTSIDLSANTIMTRFSARNSGLTSLDVSNNNDLELLYVDGNGLSSSITLTGTTELDAVWVYGNSMGTTETDAIISHLKTNNLANNGILRIRNNRTSNVVDSGQADGTSANKLIDSTQNFLTTVSIGDAVYNTSDVDYTLVTGIDSDTQLSLASDIMVSPENYEIDDSTAAKDCGTLADNGWVLIDTYTT